MSGGSYNYFYMIDALEDLVSRKYDLEEVGKDLSELEYAQDVARETQDLFSLVRQWEDQANDRIARLKDVWKALEYWRSNDSTEEDLKKELSKYREK
jgi:hypothetical protein